MDKALFRAYVKELVKEQLEESIEKSVRKLLPEILGEAVAEVKGVQKITESTTTPQKPKIDRSKLAQMMGLERHGDTIVATTKGLNPTNVVTNGSDDNPVVQAINRDYSQLMKAMGLSK